MAQNDPGPSSSTAGRGRRRNLGLESGYGGDIDRALVAKQAELEQSYDRHDTLVREMFHMENFRMMIGYSPEEAKKETTSVFQAYRLQNQYDLLDHLNSSEAGPSRRTRRSQVQQNQFLRTGSSSSASAPVNGRTNGRTKKKVHDTNTIWEILAQSKVKGKGKASSEMPSMDSESLVDSTESISVPNLKKRRVTPLDPVKPDPMFSESISVPVRKKKLRPPPRTPPPQAQLAVNESLSAPINLSPVAPRKRPKRFNDQSDNLGGGSAPPTNGVSEALPQAKTRRNLRSNNIIQPVSPVSISAPPSPLKRIKLIVNRPPTHYSHPAQRPPATQYNSSLTDFLSSFIIDLEDRELTLEAFQNQAKEEATFRDHIAGLQRAGHLVPKPDDEEVYDVPNRPKTTDTWTYVVEEMIAYQRPNPTGIQIGADIASKVKVYWVDQAAKQDKLKLLEEKKLRNLAKTTNKLIVAEWKKALFHIRQEERQALEFEERKRGEMQLDAILDQSGQILETQHGELLRGGDLSRSRSTSVSARLDGWESEEDEDDEQDGTDIDQDGDDDDEADIDQDGGDDGEEEEEAELENDDQQEDDENPDDVDNSQHDSQHPSTEQSRQSSAPPEEASDTESALAVDEMMSQFLSPDSPTPEMTENLTHYMLNSTDSRSPSVGDDRNRPPRGSPEPTNDHPLYPSVQLDVDTDDESHLPATSDDGQLADNPAEEYEEISMPEPLGEQVALEENIDQEDAMELDEPADLEQSQDDLFDEGLETAVAEDAAPSELQNNEVESAPTEPVEDSDPADLPQEDNPERQSQEQHDEVEKNAEQSIITIPEYLKPYAVAPVEWDPNSKVLQPLLLRGNLRPYQQAGLEWLATLHRSNMNGILADEMGLGKTIQTISLLAHLACDRGIWGPHLIIVPTSVLLNWEMEFKKFLPGFKILSYHGSTKRRKELRQGWTDKYHFNVCITSYTLASRDAHIFKRKSWYYMVLDEAHMIKNFKSQRWNILLMFRSFRRLLLTGTPLQNNLTELWALLQFLMSGSNFANLKEFGDWFSNPLEKAIEMGNVNDDDTLQRVSKLHTVLRPYLLRRLKRDVEKELPSKFEHLVFCPLSKRQRFLYDEYMSRANTKEALRSGVYQKIANILMQLRKVCNHPDLFEVRPIVTSFTMARSAIADYEIKELLVRRRLLNESDHLRVNLDLLGLRFINKQNGSVLAAMEARRLDATYKMPFLYDTPGVPPPEDTRTIQGFREHTEWQRRAKRIAHWSHLAYLNRLRQSNSFPIYSEELILAARRFHAPILPLSALDLRSSYLDRVRNVHAAVQSYAIRESTMAPYIDRFAFATPPVVALDLPRLAIVGHDTALQDLPFEFDAVLHRAAVKLQIAFPDPSLLQYDCGKLQVLTRLLREKKAKGSRVLIFTQMTRILDILEIFLNLHGYLYLRLDGATKIEDRQYITERFNSDSRVFCFIASSRSGGVGINLTGADTVIFYDSDFNPQMDRQCEDRAHRIGQIRDVHIYRFVSQHTVEEALLRKANQKRSLDDLVIQKGEFDWRTLFHDETALTKALGEFEDKEDAHAAAVAAREEVAMYGADELDFGAEELGAVGGNVEPAPEATGVGTEVQNEEEEDEGGTVAEYMLKFIKRDYEYFRNWKI